MSPRRSSPIGKEGLGGDGSHRASRSFDEHSKVLGTAMSTNASLFDLSAGRRNECISPSVPRKGSAEERILANDCLIRTAIRAECALSSHFRISGVTSGLCATARIARRGLAPVNVAAYRKLQQHFVCVRARARVRVCVPEFL